MSKGLHRVRSGTRKYWNSAETIETGFPWRSKDALVQFRTDAKREASYAVDSLERRCNSVGRDMSGGWGGGVGNEGEREGGRGMTQGEAAMKLEGAGEG